MSISSPGSKPLKFILPSEARKFLNSTPAQEVLDNLFYNYSSIFCGTKRINLVGLELKGGAQPTLTVLSVWHAIYVFINGPLQGWVFLFKKQDVSTSMDNGYQATLNQC